MAPPPQWTQQFARLSKSGPSIGHAHSLVGLPNCLFVRLQLNLYVVHHLGLHSQLTLLSRLHLGHPLPTEIRVCLPTPTLPGLACFVLPDYISSCHPLSLFAMDTSFSKEVSESLLSQRGRTKLSFRKAAETKHNTPKEVKR